MLWGCNQRMRMMWRSPCGARWLTIQVLGPGEDKDLGKRPVDRTVTGHGVESLRCLGEAAGYQMVRTGMFQTLNNGHDVTGMPSWILTLDVSFPSYVLYSPGSLPQRPPPVNLILTAWLRLHSALPSA